MEGIAQGFAVILGVIVAGYFAARFGIVKGDERLVLNRVSFAVASPALLFVVLSESRPEQIFSVVTGIEFLSAVLAALLFVVLSRLWFRKDLSTTVLGAASSAYVNANNLGLPIAMYVLGDITYVAPLILIQLLFFAPAVLTFLESSPGSRHGALRSFGRAASNPIIIASFLGVLFALFDWSLPAIVMGPIEMLGDAAIPLVLLSFGVSLHGQSALRGGADRAPVAVASAVKLVGMPLISWGLAQLFGLSAHETFVVVVAAALPTAQNMYNFAATYQRGEFFVRDVVMITTFASLPVIAVCALLLG